MGTRHGAIMPLVSISVATGSDLKTSSTATF
jgi:hypothetical protein